MNINSTFIAKNLEGNVVYEVTIAKIPEFLEAHPGHPDESLLRCVYENEKRLADRQRVVEARIENSLAKLAC